MTAKLLKLLAADAQDLEVVSAILQDSVVPVAGLSFKPEEKRFSACLCRFRWDGVPQDEPETGAQGGAAAGYERIHCALDLSGVEAVKISGFDSKKTSLMLDLLAILPDPEGLSFVCAGDAKIKIKAQDWQLKMQDYGESWPTFKKPCHPA